MVSVYQSQSLSEIVIADGFEVALNAAGLMFSVGESS